MSGNELLKSYAGLVFQGYEDTINRISDKYKALGNNIHAQYDSDANRIKSEYDQNKKNASVSAALTDANFKNSMVNKGLSRSGESLQGELMNNLSRNSAYALLDSQRADALAENQRSRAAAQNALYSDYLDEYAQWEDRLRKTYIEQLNLDREYDYGAERDKVRDGQWQSEFDAGREDEAFGQSIQSLYYDLDRQKYASDKAQKEFENSLNTQKFEQVKRQDAFQNDLSAKQYDLSTKQYDRQARQDREASQLSARKLALEQDKFDYEKEQKEAEKAAAKITGELFSEENGTVVPKYPPVSLVDKIYAFYDEYHYYDRDETTESVKKAIRAILEDERLDTDYRYELSVYAGAIGLYP